MSLVGLTRMSLDNLDPNVRLTSPLSVSKKNETLSSRRRGVIVHASSPTTIPSDSGRFLMRYFHSPFCPKITSVPLMVCEEPRTQGYFDYGRIGSTPIALSSISSSPCVFVANPCFIESTISCESRSSLFSLMRESQFPY